MVATIIGVVSGAALGFTYQKLVGCPGGACPITSNPWVATVYGALLGGLVAMSFGA